MQANSTVTPALENYLEAIYILQKVKECVKVNDIAHYLKVKMPSVTYNMKKLEEQKLINHEKRSHVQLTEAGEIKAREVHRRHEEIYRFFHESLGVPREMAEEDACRVEHVLQEETMARLSRFMQWAASLPKSHAYKPEPWLKSVNSERKSS